MKRRILASFLAAIMLLAIVPPMPLSAATFSDLPATHWAYPYIINLAQQGVISGFPDGTYRPEDAVTREQFARLVIALLEDGPTETEEIFSDVAIDRWSSPYISAAVWRAIILPTDYGEYFDPTAPITRQEAAVWMVRGLGFYIPPAQTTFNDNAEITYQSEIATAVEIGLITGMPGNLFAPLGTTTRAQAAVLVTRMAGILDDMAWSGEEIFHYVYRSDVTVIAEPPVYSFTEADGVFTITVYNPNDTIRSLAPGDTFVFEPTEHQFEGMAGHIISITEQGTAVIITARMPESLEEIFYEFEFSSEIDLLEMADEIEVYEGLEGAEGIEIIRNRTSFVAARLDNASIAGVTLNGEVRLYMPRLQISMTTNSVSHLVVTTAAQVNVNASTQVAFDEVFTLFTIPIMKWGTGISIPVGVRITADGQASLDLIARADAEFGIRNNRSSAKINLRYSFDFDFDARVSISANVQARASVLLIPVYGIQGDFGRGIQASTALQQRCPTSECPVVGLFHVRRISSLTDWGILSDLQFLRFTLDLAPPGLDYRYFSNGRWRWYCAHTHQASQYNQQFTTDPADGWLTLYQIQGRSGNYIKRGDMFLPIPTDHNVEFHWFTPTLSRIPAGEVLRLHINDQLVYVGTTAPQLHNASFQGFVAYYPHRAVDLWGNVLEMRFVLTRENVRPLIAFQGQPGMSSTAVETTSADYTHINGQTIPGNPVLANNIFWRGQRNMFGGYTSGVFLVGEYRQIFTLGRWQGTNWIERELVADRELYSLSTINRSIGRTYDGYFYLDFPRPESGFLFIQVPGTQSGALIAYGDTPLPHSNAIAYQATQEIPIDLNNAACGNNDVSPDNPMIGVWAWDELPMWEYHFNADGTGIRGVMGIETENFTWYTSRNDTRLHISISNPLPDVMANQSFDLTFTAGGNRVTMDSRELPYIFHYTRNCIISYNTPHPLAIALREFFDGSEGRTRAFIVDMDGTETQGILAIRENMGYYWGERQLVQNMVVLYMYGNNLISSSLSGIDYAFDGAVNITGSNRLAGFMWAGGTGSDVLIRQDGADLTGEITLVNSFDIAFSLNGQGVSEAEFNSLRNSHFGGGHTWWELWDRPDDSISIFALTVNYP